MTLQITWQEAPVYPALIKGPSVGVVDGHLLVAGGMAYPWREVEYGFGAPIVDDADDGQDGVTPDRRVVSAAADSDWPWLDFRGRGGRWLGGCGRAAQGSRQSRNG